MADTGSSLCVFHSFFRELASINGHVDETNRETNETDETDETKHETKRLYNPSSAVRTA